MLTGFLGLMKWRLDTVTNILLAYKTLWGAWFLLIFVFQAWLPKTNFETDLEVFFFFLIVGLLLFSLLMVLVETFRWNKGFSRESLNRWNLLYTNCLGARIYGDGKRQLTII